jgi:predicted AAA+ superfamily ATPase
MMEGKGQSAAMHEMEIELPNSAERRTPVSMIARTLEPKLRELSGYYPAALVTGPRQSGKTTLCR